MQVAFTPQIKKELTQLKQKDQRLFKKIHKQLKLLTKNPRHPSLRLHKLSGNLKNSWSISVDRNHRILFYYASSNQDQDSKIVIFLFGTHDEVYR